MEKVQPQRTELYAYLQFYMEELFQDSCRAVQTILDTDSGKIWKNFHAVLQECLEKIRILQQQKQKGLLHYLAFSPMQYASFYSLLFMFQAQAQSVLGNFHCSFQIYDIWKPVIIKILTTIQAESR